MEFDNSLMTVALAESGARLVGDINPGGDAFSDPYSTLGSLTEFGGQVFFTADDGETGEELWVSDGTAEGTMLVADINLNDSSSPASLLEVDGTLFFTANDGDVGEELWASDGTAEGTVLVADIKANSASTLYGFYGSSPNLLTEVGDQVFFTADDGETGRELWVSDGTTEGTQLVLDIAPFGSYYMGPLYPTPSDLTAFGDHLFFVADDAESGPAIWASDGTAEGTQIVIDVNPSNFDYTFNSYYDLTAVESNLFFVANDGTTGSELWVTDGTTAGTQQVLDINPGNNSYPLPYDLTGVDGQLFFTVDDGVTGRELWVSDGTADGTQQVVDINPSDDSGRDSAPNLLTEVDGQVFFTADNGVTGRELWVSNGTATGTQRLSDFGSTNSGDFYAYGPQNLTAAGEVLFFTVDDGINGDELWISDGTAAGTRLFQDINPGSADSSPRELSVVGDQLFFIADDGTTGRELWVASIPNGVIPEEEENSVVTGTTGDDSLSGLDGNDVIQGLQGNDFINGSAGDDELSGDNGNDQLLGGAGDDQLLGLQGDDTLQGGSGDDTLNGGAGRDTIIVSDFSGNDTFDGGTSIDILRVEAADDRNLTLSLDLGTVDDGQDGDQFFENFEQIVTGGGNDLILGDAQITLLDGSEGNDTIFGGAGKDTLLGGNGQDELNGEGGEDTLVGGTGRDTLVGGTGRDTLIGGQGNDVLVGEAGSDSFRFGSNLLDGQEDTDTIQEFQVQDFLDFSAYLGADVSITGTRVTSGWLRLDLNGEDIVNVLGSQRGLDVAEAQLTHMLEELA